MLPASVGSVDHRPEDPEHLHHRPAMRPPRSRSCATSRSPARTGLVALSTLATVEQVEGPSSVTTIRGVRSATVTVTPETADVGTASATRAGRARRARPAGRRDRRARRRDRRPVVRVLAAVPRAARRDPDRLHDHGRDVPQPAAAAAAAGLDPVRGDRCRAAAARLGHPARRAVDHRAADAGRHRGDERDRARRPGEPVPRARAWTCARRSSTGPPDACGRS